MSKAPDDALADAADWHLRLAEDPTQRPAFEAWLAECPTHRAAWRRLEETLSALVQVRPPPPVRVQCPATRRGWRRPWLAAACLTGLAVLTLPEARVHWQADAMTGVGEVRTLLLQDGSRLTLAPGSAVATSFTSGRRQVLLLRGRAYFEVTPNPALPFVIQARDAQVRVLGTAFDVRLAADALEVGVRSGRVRVSDEQRSTSVAELAAGESLELDWQNRELQLAAQPAPAIGAWLEGRLQVSDRSVDEVLDELRAYLPGWVVLRAQDQGQRRISGVYDLRDPQRALGGLAQSLGLRVRSLGPWLTVLEKP